MTDSQQQALRVIARCTAPGSRNLDQLVRDMGLACDIARSALPFEDSTSYPYLTLARRLGLDYGRVLDYADYLGGRERGAWCACTLTATCRLCRASAWGLAQTAEVHRAITEAFDHEHQRRDAA